MASPIVPVSERFLTPGSRVLVVGYGREGKSTAAFLRARGVAVTVTDRRVSGRNDLEGVIVTGEEYASMQGVDGVITSPGIPSTNRVLQSAHSAQIPITNATELFLELAPCPVVGVTGSSGKSTTSSLIAAMLQRDGWNVGLGGNIGNPMLDLLGDLGPHSVAVVELSSFQLELVDHSPHIAVITNLSPNHLDRHGSMETYARAKRRIVEFQDQDDFAVINGDDPEVCRLAAASRGTVRSFSWERKPNSDAFVDDGTVWTVVDDRAVPVVTVDEIALPGRHNVENILAAVAVSCILRLQTNSVRDAVVAFEGLPHRLHRIAEVDGVSYVDDSIATSPERAAVGLQSLSGDVIWLAGGRSKDLPWEPVLEGGGCVHAAILFGEAAEEIEDVIRARTDWRHVPVLKADTLREAVQVASKRARPGMTVLLSPGCTSFDQFQDFEARGRAFAEAVAELAR